MLQALCAQYMCKFWHAASKLLRKWMLGLASASLAELSAGQLPGDASYTKKMSRKQYNRYFKDRLVVLRIWRDRSCSLFKELKVHVQVYMNKLAGQCHERVHLMASEPDSHHLAKFRWTPQRGEFYSDSERIWYTLKACSSQAPSPHFCLSVRMSASVLFKRVLKTCWSVTWK